MSHVNLATVLQRQGDKAGAIAQLRTAVEIQPQFAEAHHKLGAALVQDGQWDSAIEHLGRAVDLSPRNVSAINDLAAALAMVGRFREALPQFRAIAQISPRNPAAWNNLGQCLIDLPDATTAERQEAIRAASRACELSSQRDPVQIQTLAMAQAKAGQFAQAAMTAQRAAVQARMAGDDGFAIAMEAEAQRYRDLAASPNPSSK
jgi:tetratricopeptide (TPR) repeat protein